MSTFSSSTIKSSRRAALSRLELRSPPLPQTLIEAMSLINQPSKLEVNPVTEMVQRDPIVIARLLQIVNSAYYGLQRSVISAERAIVMLGPVAVTGVVMGMNMLKLRSALEGPAADCFIQIIRHSIATAFMTRHLVEGPPRDPSAYSRRQLGRLGSSFTAGLLHDFGKITLVYNFPKKAAELYSESGLTQQVTDFDSREMEQLLLGYDHAEAGEYVARKLRFPSPLIDVIRFHHETEAKTGDRETDRLVRATTGANIAAKAFGFHINKPISWETCLQHPIWQQIVAHDLPKYGTPKAILTELKAQEVHLNEYVSSLTASATQLDQQLAQVQSQQNPD